MEVLGKGIYPGVKAISFYIYSIVVRFETRDSERKKERERQNPPFHFSFQSLPYLCPTATMSQRGALLAISLQDLDAELLSSGFPVTLWPSSLVFAYQGLPPPSLPFV